MLTCLTCFDFFFIKLKTSLVITGSCEPLVLVLFIMFLEKIYFSNLTIPVYFKPLMKIVEMFPFNLTVI